MLMVRQRADLWTAQKAERRKNGKYGKNAGKNFEKLGKALDFSAFFSYNIKP